MGRAGGLRVGGIARAGALVAACLALAACTAADKLGSRNSKYSKRIVQDGEPVPKGGGSYKVGQPYQLNGRTYYPNENPNYRGEGIASWYGPDFHGRETANGEVYDMHGISAAHTTMPIPSYARVTNLDNGRSIIVRVNDRGPYVANRIIDLSIGTAKALDFYSRGLARVRVEYVGRAPLQGTDDSMLLATLRQGGPAPVPSLVMVAAAKPLVPTVPRERESPVLRSRDDSDTLMPAGRPYGSAPTSARAAVPVVETASTGRAERAAARGPERRAAEPASGPYEAQIGASSAGGVPAGLAPGSLGLMSGRGLY
jgi:rare lipoprotein A